MYIREQQINLKEYIDNIITQLDNNDMIDNGWSNTLVIGDVHFGIKSGSVQWMEVQKNFFKQQIFPLINKSKQLNISNIVFLGDMFDVRSSVNTYIAIEVKKLIRELCINCYHNNINIYIIAGNHDFYSPDEQYKEYNSYDVVFGKEFIKTYTNLYIITDNINYIYKENIKTGLVYRIELLPWFETYNKETFLHNLNIIHSINNKKTQSNSPICGAYSHCDLINAAMDSDLYKKFKHINIPFWAGHLHYICQHNSLPLYNIGACMQYNYADTDSDRFIYIINEPENKIVPIINIITPKFKKIQDKDIFNDDIFSLYKETEFLQLDILNENINNKKYTDRIKEIRLQLTNTDIRINTIFSDIQNNVNNITLTNNIEEYIYNNTPDKLKEELSYIKENI